MHTWTACVPQMHWSAGTACRDTYWVGTIMGVLSWQEVTRQMPQSCTFCKCCLVHSVHGHNMDVKNIAAGWHWWQVWCYNFWIRFLSSVSIARSGSVLWYLVFNDLISALLYPPSSSCWASMQYTQVLTYPKVATVCACIPIGSPGKMDIWTVLWAKICVHMGVLGHGNWIMICSDFTDPQLPKDATSKPWTYYFWWFTASLEWMIPTKYVKNWKQV